ncbi:MAG: hypothetical protein A4E53_00068 [Pelotomaculum sp. PtaB.Bin104]|nr:MAG: hypothetical protein A4E53_00068 [Pelotomaculum sp. PtaB.Bin104]
MFQRVVIYCLVCVQRRCLANFATIQDDERGNLDNLVWVVGAGVVVALVIVGAMNYAPQTAQSFWQAATNWIRSSFGF